MDDQLIALAISLVGQNLWLPDATSVAILVLSPLIFLERTPGFPLPSKRVSKQVWNRIRNVCEQSEHRLQKSLYFAPKYCFFSLF